MEYRYVVTFVLDWGTMTTVVITAETDTMIVGALAAGRIHEETMYDCLAPAMEIDVEMVDKMPVVPNG